MDAVLRWLDRLQGRWRPVQFAVAVGRKFADDQARNLAALLAYYAFLATFPLLLVLVTLLGIVLHDNSAAQQRVLHSALVDFPIIGDQLKGNIHSLNRTGAGLIVGLVGTFFGARGLTLAVQNAFNTVWGVPYTRRPPFFGRQLRSLALLVVVAVAIIVTGTLSGVASVLGHRGLAVTFGVLAASAAVNVGLFVLGFRLATAREVPTRCFAPAAVISAVGWQVAAKGQQYRRSSRCSCWRRTRCGRSGCGPARWIRRAWRTATAGPTRRTRRPSGAVMTPRSR